MNETTLRVIQALELKDSFQYVLSVQDMQYLINEGYIIIVKDISDFGGFMLFDCIITRNVIY